MKKKMKKKFEKSVVKKQSIKQLSTRPEALAGFVLVAIFVTYLVLSPTEVNEEAPVAINDSDNRALIIPLPKSEIQNSTQEALLTQEESQDVNAPMVEEHIVEEQAAEEQIIASTDMSSTSEDHENDMLKVDNPVEEIENSSVDKNPISHVETQASIPNKVVEKKSINPTPKDVTQAASIKPGTTPTSKRRAVKSWVFAKQSEQYTMQIVGSSKKANILDFIKTNNKNDELSYFHTIKNNKSWYVVVQGNYKTFGEAERAIKRLPQNLAKYGPWTRKYSSIQKEVSANAEKLILLSTSFAATD